MKKRRITLFILALGILCMIAGCTDNQGSVGEPYNHQTVLPDKETAKEEAAEVATDGNKKQADSFELVSNGVRFEIPKEYEITLSEEEKSVYMHDEDYRFELVMLVQDGVFEDSLKDPDRLMDKAKKEDITLDKPVAIVEVNGKQYAYFTYTYNDKSSTNTLIFTSLGENKKLGINLVRYADISEEDIVRELDSFLSTAKETEQPDTTIADLAKQDDNKTVKDVPGELLESVKYEVQDKSLTTNVADGYYFLYDYDSEETAGMLFSNLEETIDVSTMYFAENFYDKAEDYVKERLSLIDESDPDYSDISISKIQSMSIGGLHVAYGDVSFVYGGNENSRLYAATILDDDSLYTMDVTSAYGEELSFDHYKAFFER